MAYLAGTSVSPKSAWINAGNITTAQSDPAVTARSAASIEALSNTITLTPPVGAYAMLLRSRTDGTEDDNNVLQVYATRGDHYHKAAQLTCVQGQQLYSTGIYFGDTFTPASEDALFDGEESNLANQIAHYYMRTLGNEQFRVLLSTKAAGTTTVYLDVAWLYE